MTAVLGVSHDAPGLLAGVLSWRTDVLTAASVPRSDAGAELARLRVDLLKYMVGKYMADAAQAGGTTLAQAMSDSADPPTA